MQVRVSIERFAEKAGDQHHGENDTAQARVGDGNKIDKSGTST